MNPTVFLTKRMRRLGVSVVFFFTIFFLAVSTSWAAPSSELWGFWSANNAASQASVDHGAWNDFLGKYLVIASPGSVNLVKYSQVSKADKAILSSYLERLQKIPVTTLNRNQQRAYWINLYNAQTVALILQYPQVKSIRDIKLGGLFSSGPWDEKLLSIEGQKVSLNDIEHRILRPIWKDARVHFAVNCASLGCPNLQPQAFTAENTVELLDKGAREFINSVKGVRSQAGNLVLSSIFSWFSQDFGTNLNEIKDFLLKYAQPQLAKQIKDPRASVSYEYDWSLNGL